MSASKPTKRRPRITTGTMFRPGDRCDKCDLPIGDWDREPECRGASITQSPRHTITRYHIPIPEDER